MFVYCLTLNATQKLRSYEYIWPLLAASNYFLNYITVGCRSTALLYEDCLKSFMTKKQPPRLFLETNPSCHQGHCTVRDREVL